MGNKQYHYLRELRQTSASRSIPGLRINNPEDQLPARHGKASNVGGCQPVGDLNDPRLLLWNPTKSARIIMR